MKGFKVHPLDRNVLVTDNKGFIDTLKQNGAVVPKSSILPEHLIIRRENVPEDFHPSQGSYKKKPKEPEQA